MVQCGTIAPLTFKRRLVGFDD